VSDDPRWTAVEHRDEPADGTFVYAVSTTGIYCRPSCPARRPKPGNVRFFEGPAGAEAGGFRPCLRCHPAGPTPAQRRVAAVTEACRLIEHSIGELDLDAVATAVGMSRFHFQRVFKAETGVTPKGYADARRAAVVRDHLDGPRSVTAAIYDAGFGSTGPFYAEAGSRLGMTPSEFRAGAPDVEVRFAVGTCSLGSVLVAATGRGVCAIDLGEDPEALVQALEDRFHAARLTPGDDSFLELVSRVITLIENPGLASDLPLDIRGTAFQQRVWEALRAIPSGTTATYSEIADRLGLPRSQRAVAQACAANVLAVAIPCHRVVRIDGGLAGYRWGVQRKRTLLEREAQT
jgi:AraC family transcriptional regulator of adaptative response/methylated-DNA-[protein]-cysteine methyltransferase